MLVNFVPISFQHKTTNRSAQNQRVTKQNLAPLAYDTVSFSGKENKQIEIDKIKADLKDAIKNNDAKTIYRYFGIDVDEDKEGYLTISAYKQPSYDYTFEDLGMDENKLFEKVKYIKGNANFYRSRIENLGSIESIGGNVYIRCSKLKQKDFANIKVGGTIRKDYPQ